MIFVSIFSQNDKGRISLYVTHASTPVYQHYVFNWSWIGCKKKDMLLFNMFEHVKVVYTYSKCICIDKIRRHLNSYQYYHNKTNISNEIYIISF